MGLERILKLGNPLLYQKCDLVTQDELPGLKERIVEMHELIKLYRIKYNAGRAIAAPQIGLMKRIICYNHIGQRTIINPTLTNCSEEMIELWDDCMSFPELLVKVRRHRYCNLVYRDENWKEQSWVLSDDLSELMQHEYDHLNGILATMRAIDQHSFKYV